MNVAVTAVTSPTGATEPGTGAAAGTPGSGAPAAAAVWTDGLSDPGLRDFAVNKGYNKTALSEAAPAILQQYQSLEKLFGAEKAGRTVELPDFEKADEATMGAFYERLGRPKEAKEYDFQLPSGGAVDKDFTDAMAGLSHKSGLTARQATAMAKGYQEFSAARDAANVAVEQARFAEEDKGLKTEWGAAYDNKMSIASAAAKSLGVPAEALDALQKVAGYGAVMKTFANIAAKIGEDNFVSADGGRGVTGVMTPAEADSELRKLQADRDWMASWMDKSHPKHKEAVARKTMLTAMLAGQRAS